MKIFREKLGENLMSLVYILAGIIMLVNPKFVCDAVNYIIGGLIIVFGVIFVIRLFQDKDIKQFSKIELLIVFLCIGLGLYFIFNSTLLSSILPIAAGILILLDSISQIMKAFRLKKNKLSYWYINGIVGLVFLAFSIYIIINANSVTYLIVRLIGLVLIIDAIFEFYTSFRLKEYDNSVKVLDTEIVVVKKD